MEGKQLIKPRKSYCLYVVMFYQICSLFYTLSVCIMMEELPLGHDKENMYFSTGCQVN